MKAALDDSDISPTALPRVVVTNRAHDHALAQLHRFASVEANVEETPWPRAEVLRRCAKVDGMLAFMTDHVDEAFLDACPRLRAIGCALKGADNFDLAACRARGVAVAVVPDLLTIPTAELAIGLIIALGRNVIEGDRLVRSGTFEGWRPTLYGTGLVGTTVGIIGFGRVGQAIAARLAGFGCRLIYSDNAVVSPPAGFEHRPLQVLLAEADWVVLAAPLTPSTLHLINSATLAVMRPGAMLVNCARGSLVDEGAVAAALAENRLGDYAADVFELEDWARADRPRAIPPARDPAHAVRAAAHGPHAAPRFGRRRSPAAHRVHAAESLECFFEGRPMPGRIV